MACFDLELFGVRSGRRIGTGSDCLDLDSMEGVSDIGGFAISNTSFFRFEDGTLQTRNRTTVQPTIDGSPTMTHLTASMPLLENVIGGTGVFEGASGTARLHGGIDMSEFDDGVVTFACVFVIELD